ncbi:MAG TPA: CopG family transcriptional regulator [Candidatus Nitrosotalea sp.]|nr:CopG family transcriptional regulator [Candidatus Nitrosotalea sp.]
MPNRSWPAPRVRRVGADPDELVVALGTKEVPVLSTHRNRVAARVIGLIEQAQNAWPPGGRRFSVVYDTYIMRRTQIYLDDGQVAQLRAAAKTSAKSVSEIIRDAIDEKLARVGEVDDFERALAGVAGIWADRGDIGSTDEYVRKVRQDRRGAPSP